MEEVVQSVVALVTQEGPSFARDAITNGIYKGLSAGAPDHVVQAKTNTLSLHELASL